MPEAAVNEHRNFSSREGDVYTPPKGAALIVHTVSVALRVEA